MFIEKSKIWKRTVTYFAIIIVLYFGVAAYFFSGIGVPVAESHILIDYHTSSARHDIAELKKIRRDLLIAGVDEKIILSVIEPRLKKNLHRLAHAASIKKMERIAKTPKNEKKIVAALKTGYAELIAMGKPEFFMKEIRLLNLKSAGVVTVFLLGIGVIMILLTSLILNPLERIIQAARKVAAGDLDVRFRLRTSDELSHLADVLNDLTANFRELLTLIKRSHADNTKHLETIKNADPNSPEFKTGLENMDQAFRQMKEMTEYFSGTEN